jgi:hypothetical protein
MKGKMERLGRRLYTCECMQAFTEMVAVNSGAGVWLEGTRGDAIV